MDAGGVSRKLVFAALAVVLGFASLEAVGRVVEVFRPSADVDYGLGFESGSRVFVADPDDPARWVTAPEKRRFFLEQSFATHKPERTLRVGVVGGSSVRYADDELRLMAQAVSAATPGVQVELINAGALGYGSHRVVLVAGELLEHDLDALLVYSGHNEFEEIEQLALTAPATGALQATLAEHSAFFRVLRDVVTTAQVGSLRREHNEKVLSKFPAQARAWNHPFTPEDVVERMAGYERNLRLIVRLAEEAGVPVVLGTVPSNHYRPTLPPGVRRAFMPIFRRFEQGEWAEAGAAASAFLAGTLGRHQSSATENAIIRRVAQETGTLLADVEGRVRAAEPHGVPGETLFRDHCHLNQRGNRLWRESYQPIVAELLASD